MIKINSKRKTEKAISKTPVGFQMTFENGNTISVQFGEGNYCANRRESKNYSKDAEIAIWNKDGENYKFDDRDVVGWQTTDEVAKWIDFAAKTTF